MTFFQDVIGQDRDSGVGWHDHHGSEVYGELALAELTADKVRSGLIRGRDIRVVGGTIELETSDGDHSMLIDPDFSEQAFLIQFTSVDFDTQALIGANNTVGSLLIQSGTPTAEPTSEQMTVTLDPVGRRFLFEDGEFGGFLDFHSASGSNDAVIAAVNQIDGTIEFDATQVLFPDGTVSLPAVAFAGDLDTGVYLHGADVLALAAGGVQVGLFSESGGAAQVAQFAGIAVSTTGNSANVHTNASGRLFTSTSSARYKTDLAPWDRRHSVLDVTPTLFRSLIDDDDDSQRLGLIAEDVAEHFPIAAITDDQGRPDAIEWNTIVAGLIAEVQALRKELAHAD